MHLARWPHRAQTPRPLWRPSDPSGPARVRCTVQGAVRTCAGPAPAARDGSFLKTASAPCRWTGGLARCRYLVRRQVRGTGTTLLRFLQVGPPGQSTAVRACPPSVPARTRMRSRAEGSTGAPACQLGKGPQIKPGRYYITLAYKNCTR